MYVDGRKIDLHRDNQSLRCFLFFDNLRYIFLYLLGLSSAPPQANMSVWKRQSPLGVTVFMLECISSIFSGSPPHHHTNPALSPLIATETSDTEITTTEIIKRRDVGPYGIRSEYCIRKIICPLGVPETPKGKEVFLFSDTEDRV